MSEMDVNHIIAEFILTFYDNKYFDDTVEWSAITLTFFMAKEELLYVYEQAWIPSTFRHTQALIWNYLYIE